MKRIIVCAAVWSMTLAAFADGYYSKLGFSIDLPEGFAYTGGNGSTTFSFALGQVKLDIALWPKERFAAARSGAEAYIKSMAGKGSAYAFSYRGYDAALLDARNSSVMVRAVFVNNVVPPAALAQSEYDMSVVVSVPQAVYEKNKDIVESALDGFAIGAALGPGPVAAALRSKLASRALKTARVSFAGANIDVAWNPEEARIAQYVVEREYRVLVPYSATPALVQAAVGRFYRMVYRDAAPALDRLALEMAFCWERARTAAGKDMSPRDYAEDVLAWVQTYTYERSPEGSDVVNPITAAFEKRGDCDSRALVMALLVRRENIRPLLMVSLVHNHALGAVDVAGQGARFPFDGAQWLVAETTAKVALGRIDAQQADPAAWFGVSLPF